MEMDERLIRLAYTDDLTGLFNRRYLYQILPKEIKVSENLVLLMVDIDKFKNFNDRYGHLTGDHILRQVSMVLKEDRRKEDVVIRYAGDEFIVILPHTQEEGGFAVAERIRKKVEDSVFCVQEEGPALFTTLSIGLATYPKDASSVEELINQADKALYYSKEKGRNRTSKISDIKEEVIDKSKILDAFPCKKLVNRKEEILSFQESLDLKQGVILLKGDAGVGKTRLLEEFKRIAQKKGFIVLHGMCYEEYTESPYRPLQTILERYFKILGEISTLRFLKGLKRSDLNGLIKLIPSLGKMFHYENLPDERVQVFRCISSVLNNLSKETPLVLLFDDFHWVDSGTIQVISEITKKETRILVIGAFRYEEARDSLKGFRREIERKRLFLELELKPFSLLDVSEMIQAIFQGLKRDPEFDQLIYRVTEGNPLFIEEVLKSLVEENFIYYKDGMWHRKEIYQENIPSSLREVIYRRFTTLDEETKDILNKASVIGKSFNLMTLQKLGDINEGYLREIIDRALACKLIKQETDTEFGFVSEIIQESLYQRAANKKDFHLRIGEIEEKGGDIEEIAAKLAYHFQKGGDIEKATLYAVKAREKAKELFVYEEAAKYLERMERPPMEVAEHPLDEESFRLMIDEVKFLTIAITNVRMYPKGSEIIKGSLEKAYKNLAAVLERNEAVTLSDVEGRLLINGEELGKEFSLSQNRLLSFMRDLGLSSITILKGLDLQELNTFLEATCKRREEFYKVKLSHIGFNLRKYVTMDEFSQALSKVDIKRVLKEYERREEEYERKEEEEGEEKGFRFKEAGEVFRKKAEHIKREIGEFSKHIFQENPEEALREIEKRVSTVNGEKREDTLDLISEEISSLPSAVLTHLLTQESSRRLGIKDRIISRLPFTKTMELLDQAIKEYKEKGSEDLEEILSYFLRQEKENFSPEVYQKLYKAGILKKILSKIDKPKKEKKEEELIRKAKEFLGLEVIPMRLFDEIPVTATELLAFGEDGLVEDIILRLISDLEKDKTKFKDAFALKRIFSSLKHLGKEDISRKLMGQLISHFRKEKDTQVFLELAGILEEMAKGLLKDKVYEEGKRIIDLFGREYDQEKNDYLRGALERIREENLSELIMDFIKGHSLQDVSEILITIRADLPLIDVIKREDDLEIRKAASSCLNKMGKEAILRLGNELMCDLPAENLVRMLEVIPEIEDPDIFEKASRLLTNPDFKVKKKTLEVLCKRGDRFALELILQALNDEEIYLRRYALNILGEMKKEIKILALEALIDLLDREEDVSQKREICNLLGDIGDTRALSPLNSVIKESSLFLFRREIDRGLVIAAIKSIGKIGGEEAKRILEEVAMDKRREVRTMAEITLRRLG
ncbi:MAG: diguanylate cyclase [bacterium]|nr:diguanylate cyclase [bacterium]